MQLSLGKSLSYEQSLFNLQNNYLIYSKVSFIPELIIITPVFSVTWSSRNHSNMRIWWSTHSYDYHYCWKQFIFLCKPSYILFLRILWWKESSMETEFVWNRIFCNIINVFPATSINASLNKSIQFFKINLTDHKLVLIHPYIT